MATTSKSPRAVILAALATARRSLPSYSHRCSPKKFTQHQLFACLVLKSFLKTDYRGVVAHLADCPSLAEAIGLSEVPHYTTLQKAARRLLASTPAKRLLDATVREHLGRQRCVAARRSIRRVWRATAASGYFVHRRRYIGGPGKPWFIIAFRSSAWCASRDHFILAAEVAVDRSPMSPTFGRCWWQCWRGCD